VVLHYDNGQMTLTPPQGEQEIGAITFLHGGPEVIAAGSAGWRCCAAGSSAPQRGRSRRAVARVRHGDRANGDRWFNGSKGVVQVRAADWQAAVAAPHSR
jgi:hypothetical protein